MLLSAFAPIRLSALATPPSAVSELEVVRRFYAHPVNARLTLLSFVCVGSLAVSSVSAFEGPYYFYESTIRGKTLACMPKDDFVRDTPTWKAGDPLPLTEEQIIKSAKAELDRHIPNPAEWEFRAFDIVRFRAGGNPKWYFVLFFETPPTFEPKGTSGIQTVRVVVNFSGVALPLIETKRTK